MQSQAKTVTAYLNELPPERKAAISRVRETILKHLPKGYEETMQYGMICYVVPLSRYPKGYAFDGKTPLPYASLGSQKNYMAVYLMCTYGNPQLYDWFVKAYKASGKKLNMGKSCIRFTKLENLPLQVIGEAVAKTTVDEFITTYEKARKK